MTAMILTTTETTPLAVVISPAPAVLAVVSTAAALPVPVLFKVGLLVITAELALPLNF